VSEETEHSIERVVVGAAGYGSLWGPDPLRWPEFALRAMNGWVGGALQTERGALDAAMHSVWLHGNWRWLTQNMSTPEREAAADAVSRHSAVLEPDEPVEPERWWREDD
jgi:hypothetical protein